MKKVFLFFLCALTICTLFIMPASAAGDNSIVIEVEEDTFMGHLGYALPFGKYKITLVTDSGNLELREFCLDSYERCYTVGDYGEVDLCIYDNTTTFGFTVDGVKRVILTRTDVQDGAAGASIWDVFVGIGNYISESLNSATTLFYNAETATLTPVGTLSLVAVAIGLAILVVVLLRNYLHLS